MTQGAQDKFRALHVISSAGVYGAERLTLRLLSREWVQSATLALFEKADGSHLALAEAAAETGASIELLPDGGASFARNIAVLRRLMRTATIIQSHGYKANVLSALGAMGHAAAPLICSEHGFTDRNWKSVQYGRIDRAALRLSSVKRVVCVTPQIRDRCLRAGVPGDKVEVIQNAISISHVESIGFDKKDIDFLYVGRLSYEKGADILLDALAKLDGKPARLVIVGEGPLEGALRQAAAALPANVSVEFAGYRKNWGDFAARAKWLVLPSRTEGLPLALLEALGAGVPAIAADVGDIPSLAKLAGWGRLVASGDIAGLTEALDAALGVEEQSWTAQSRAGAAIVRERYNIEDWDSAWRRTYQSVAAA